MRANVEIGQRFHRLVVVDVDAGRTKQGCMLVGVKCDCGTQKIVRLSLLRNGVTKSCGCYCRERTAESHLRHGCGRNGKQTPEYRSWADMIRRTSDPSRRDFPNYGGRGIAVCERWRDFPAFLADMGYRPPGCSIDRIDVDGNYEPSNCRWSTRTEQNRNTRRNRLVTFCGRRMSLAEACEIANIPYGTVKSRITRLGWSEERALSIPARSKP